MSIFRCLTIAVFMVGAASRVLAASPDEAARFLAGMSIPTGSSLSKLTESPGWKRHAQHFEQAFRMAETRQLSRIRLWASKSLPPANSSLLYFFSGPDFMYADAFFPQRKNYLLSGLEPVGALPDLEKIPPERLFGALDNLNSALFLILNVSFFRTNDMRSQLQSSALTGTIPVLYVFLARSGKQIHEVTLIELSSTGDISPIRSQTSVANGVQIEFSSPGGERQKLYYFSGDVSNTGFRKSGLEAFAQKFENADGLIKSASYLLHSGGFSYVRDFLLKNAKSLLQDDSGIPLSFVAKDRTVTAFGNYNGPIAMFNSHWQPGMVELYRKQEKKPLPFGIGYRWRPDDSNLVLAVK